MAEYLKLSPSNIKGEVNIPPSKSFAHRALLCAALSGGDVYIKNISSSKDMLATENFLSVLGIKTQKTNDENEVYLEKCSEIQNTGAIINSIESGSTLRFIIPIALALGIDCTIIGSGLLPERPIGVYSDLLPLHGGILEFLEEGKSLPLHISGKLKCGDYYLPGNVSSQFITGLMYALPLLDGDSKIIITTELQSKSYLDITISVLKEFGVIINETEYGFYVKGNQQYIKSDYTVEGDWSQMAFYLTMACFSKEGITVNGLNPDSCQGDKKALDIYKSMGLKIDNTATTYYLSNPNFEEEYHGLKAVNFNAEDIPDAVPAISFALSVCNGQSIVCGAERLRIKESDRLCSTKEALDKLGADITETDDGFIINGVKSYSQKDEILNGYNDHRIVMSISSISALLSEDIYVSDPWSIRKSYPNFYDDFNSIGGQANVINMG